MKVGQKFFIIALLGIILGLAARMSIGVTAGVDREESLLKKALAKTGAEYIQMQYNGWIKINKRFTYDKDAQQYFHALLHSIPYKNSPEINIANGNNGALIISAQGKIDTDGILRLSMIYYPESAKLKRQNLLVSSFASRTLIPVRIEEMLKKIEPEEKVNSSLVCSGKIKGIVPNNVMKSRVENILTWMHSKEIDIMENDQVVSVTGWTPMLSKRLTVEKKSVNINMAFRYNFVENNTLVYIGTPVITSEY